jgi:methyl-accepting chemotaxis protein
MDQVTQQNAALVEETASTAESMRNQATHLAQLVSVFKLAPTPAKNPDADRKSSRKIHWLSSAIR